MPVTATIGVYDFDAVTFSKTLLAAGVDLLVDVRQRRGVRGSQYAWANSLRLQGLLAGAGIAYSHHRELAPTTELRHLQYRADDRTGVGKRTRELLAPEYVARYTSEILDHVDLGPLICELDARSGLGALLCVESEPAACHRSLITARLAERHGYSVTPLRPPASCPHLVAGARLRELSDLPTR